MSENLSHLSEVQDNKTHPVDKSWQVFLPVAAVRHLHDAEVHSTGKYWSHSAQSLFNIVRRSNQSVQVQDGYINETHHIFGTYCHGIFDNDDLRRAIINALRKRKGLETLPVQFRYRQYKESEFDRLADTVRKHFDMKKFYEVLG